MGATGTIEIGVVGIARLAVVLGFSSMSVDEKMICKVIREICREMAGREKKEDLLRMKYTYP